MATFMVVLSVMLAMVLFIVAAIPITFTVIARAAIYGYRTVSAFRYDYYSRTFYIPDRRVIVVGLTVDDSRYANGNINIHSRHGC